MSRKLAIKRPYETINETFLRELNESMNLQLR
jgi:hypothetical protein